MPKITTDELKEIRQKLCTHNQVQLSNNIFGYICLDCGKILSFIEVEREVNLRLKEIIGVN